ncbi:P-loop ATPase, Sll1717 family [Roseomonas genomospecies 6]|uniref:P-loop ATPase, Sll1717 family n=1 Tax=Roseomonas genomospecies 6 TaxID=214106 RepID=UPI0011F2B880|nr:hypothetical protein [Roseomonas genomospecies 6]
MLKGFQSISDMNFGEYDAVDEDATNPSFFEKSFVIPFSFSMSTLSNRRNYIIIGKKGAGKTAAQLYLKSKLEREGFITNFFSFFDGISHQNYNDLAKTQKIDFLKIDINNLKNLFNYYDFRSVWERVLYVQLSACMSKNGINNAFTSFVNSTVSNKTSGLLNGILKSLKIEVQIPLHIMSAKLSFDPTNLVNSRNEMDISSFNDISRELLIRECSGLKVYMFIDELVFSKLDSQDDEIKVRSALIRDILRVSHDLNRDLCRNCIDIHFICTLRPEIRNFLNELDAEISKIIDSKDVLLHWNSDHIDDNILITLFKKKIECGSQSHVDMDNFIDKTIRFGKRPQSTYKFILHNSWYRPRDIIRYLKSYQKVNPSHTRLSEDGFKNCLNEYARVSAKEIMDELSVNYGQTIVCRLRNAIRKQEYADCNELMKEITGIPNVDLQQLCDDMFHAGIIGNVDATKSGKRYFWSHRGEEFLIRDMHVTVHPGLWNYFNIRHS